MSKQLTVTAEDREAAAACMHSRQAKAEVLDGDWDESSTLQAFAAHRIKALEQAAGVADAEEASRVAMFNQNSASINAHRATAAYEIATAIRALKDTSYD